MSRRLKIGRSFFLNDRGMALFSMLVGIMFLVISILVVINVQEMEKSRLSQLSVTFGQELLGDVIAGVRADALQTVIFATREAYSFYLDSLGCGTGMNVDNVKVFTSQSQPWKDSIDAFIQQELIGASPVINNVVERLKEKVSLRKEDLLLGNNAISFQPGDPAVWSEVRDQLRRKGEKAYEVIGCPSPNNCPQGSFFIVLALDELSVETLSRLPQLRIEKVGSGQAITEPLLPTARIPVYVQFRLFKALSNAKKMFNSIESNSSKLFGSGQQLGFSGPQVGTCKQDACSCMSDPWNETAGKCIDVASEGLPERNCGNVVSAQRSLAFNQSFGPGATLSVSGKYNCSTPEVGLGFVVAESMCAIASATLKEDGKMTPLKGSEIKSGSGSWAAGCKALAQLEEASYPFEGGAWTVSENARNAEGLAFKVSVAPGALGGFEAARVVNFEYPDKQKFATKKVCLQKCKAMDLITAIGLPTSVTRAILGGAAIGGVYGLECKPDQDPHFGIPLPENTYCSRPSGVFEMCAAFKDEDPNHAFSSEETDYYFDVTFIPGGAQANVQKVELAKINNLEKQLALTGDCSGEQCNASPGNFVCSHSSVSNALGLEYYPPEWGVDELCAPQGVDPCVKDVNPVAFSSRIQADPVLAEAQKTLNDFVPCETELDSMKECCADGDGKKECEDADSSVVSNVEDCKEACKAGSKVQVKQGEEPKYLCEEKRNDWSECIKDDSRNGYGDEEKAAQEKIKEALEDYKRECASRTVSWSSTGLYGGRNGRDVIIESCGESGGC